MRCQNNTEDVEAFMEINQHIKGNKMLTGKVRGGIDGRLTGNDTVTHYI